MKFWKLLLERYRVKPDSASHTRTLSGLLLRFCEMLVLSIARDLCCAVLFCRCPCHGCLPRLDVGLCCWRLSWVVLCDSFSITIMFLALLIFTKLPTHPCIGVLDVAFRKFIVCKSAATQTRLCFIVMMTSSAPCHCISIVVVLSGM